MAELVELARLSEAARELLVAARKNRNRLFLVRIEQPGNDYVDAGSISFPDPLYVATVQDLCDAAYFRTQNRQYYELTAGGIVAADALQDASVLEDLQSIWLRKTVLADLHRFHRRRGYNRAEEFQAQADRLSIPPDVLRTVWGYLHTIGAIQLQARGQGFPLRAQLTAIGVQLDEAGDKAALAGEGDQATMITAEQLIIAGRDAHHIQHGTANVQHEGLDADAVICLVQEIRQLIEQSLADPAQRDEALADLDDIEAAAKDHDPGVIARAKEALTRLCTRMRPPATDMATMFTLLQMIEKLWHALGPS